jgi:hypothetical protein
MATPQRPMNADALKKVEKLSDQLDTAEDASEATTKASEATTKKVRHARRTNENVKRALRRLQRPGSTKPKRTRSKDRYTGDGKSKAAVELGRRGGAARAKTLTRQQRSVLAMKAAKTRWNKR